MATENAGEFIRCTAGLRSFGGNGGTFSGFATDCIGEDGSFGGAEWMSADGVLSGTLVRCTARGLVAARARPWTLNGATIDNCLFSTAGTTWKDCFLLTDSTSSVTNSTVLVVETGTGIAINSAAAQSVSAVGNRYNNSDNDDDGLGADVTNVGVNTTGATAAEVKTAIEANGSKIDHLWETTEDNGDGVRQFTVDGLENAPSGTGSTPTQMWAYATRTLTEDAAPTASEIWAATSRTLTGGGTVNVSSTVTDDNDIDIVQHDDYLTAYDRQLSWTNSGGDWFGEDLTDAAVAFTAMERDGTVIITKAGAVVTATGTQAVSVDLTAANTALFTKPGKRYKYQLLLTKATYRETEVTGDITVTLTNNEPD